MSHVDEGALHAYLDGALDEYPAGEARRIRQHLDVCAACADQLAAERRVREEARAILGRAAPDVDVPGLEELKARARASQPTRTPASARLYRLGWVASVVLALGVGWLLRGEPVQGPERTGSSALSPAGGVASGPSESMDRTAATADEPETAPFDEASPGAATDEPAASTLVQRDAGPDAPDRAAEATPSTDAVPPTAEGAARLLSGTAAAGLAAPDVRAPGPFAPPSSPVTLRGVLAERQPAPGDTPDRDAEAAERSSQGPVLTSALTAEPAPGPAARRRDPGDRDEPRDADSGSLVVPGLELIAVLPVSEGRTFAGMRALQRLENGDTLEVVHLAEGAAPSTLPSVRADNREIVLERGAGWIVMRAPRTEEELLALLQRLEAGN